MDDATAATIAGAYAAVLTFLAILLVEMQRRLSDEFEDETQEAITSKTPSEWKSHLLRVSAIQKLIVATTGGIAACLGWLFLMTVGVPRTPLAGGEVPVGLVILGAYVLLIVGLVVVVQGRVLGRLSKRIKELQ